MPDLPIQMESLSPPYILGIKIPGNTPGRSRPSLNPKLILPLFLNQLLSSSSARGLEHWDWLNIAVKRNSSFIYTFHTLI
jgi:hypothetical protein